MILTAKKVPKPKPPARPPFTVLVDTREQNPWLLPGAIRATLRSGDYSILTLEDKISLERKSHADLCGSVGKGRLRFEREMVRLASFRFAAIVVEASLEDILLRRPERSRMHPHSTIATLADWSVQYGVHIVFAGNRDMAAAYAYKLLSRAWIVLTSSAS